MGPIMKASGSMINSMGMELNHGQMEQDTKVIMKMERKKDKADLHLLTVATTKDSSRRTRFPASATTTGLTARLTRATGKITRWTVKARSNGKTERAT